jgi:hypothetical protein
MAPAFPSRWGRFFGQPKQEQPRFDGSVNCRKKIGTCFSGRIASVALPARRFRNNGQPTNCEYRLAGIDPATLSQIVPDTASGAASRERHRVLTPCELVGEPPHPELREGLRRRNHPIDGGCSHVRTPVRQRRPPTLRAAIWNSGCTDQPKAIECTAHSCLRLA